LNFRPLLLLLLFSSLAFAQSYPSPQGFVTDTVGVLSPADGARIEALATEFERNSTVEFAVLIVATTGEQDIFDYAFGVSREWGVGKEETNNGLVMVVATEDRKVWVSVGYGLEGALNDAKVGAILDNYVVPKLATDDYGGGIYDGLEAMRMAIGGEYVAGVDDAGGVDDFLEGDPLLILAVLALIFGVFGFIIFAAIKSGGMRRGRGRWGGGLGGFGGAGGGGGFGGFGGGGFGGGGGGRGF